LPITRTVASIHIYNITSNINVIHVCALIKNSYNVKPTNTLMLLIYLTIHLYSIYAVLLFSNFLKMIKTYRNMSELQQIVCKNTVTTLVHLLVRLCKQLAKSVIHISPHSLRKDFYILFSLQFAVVISYQGVSCKILKASLLVGWGPLMVAQWLRYCATNRKVAGSIPDGVIGIFQ
jgi:hypothetical protein